MTAGGDGPAAPGRGQAFRPSDGYQSEAEPAGGPTPRGRGGQRGRVGRGLHGSRDGDGGAGRYCETDVEGVSPGRAAAPLRRRSGGRSPSQSAVAAAIRPLEAPAQPVVSRLAGGPPPPQRHGAGLLPSPPRHPPPAAAVNHVSTPPATAVQAKSPLTAGGGPGPVPAAAPAAAATPAAVYAATLEPGNTYQVGLHTAVPVRDGKTTADSRSESRGGNVRRATRWGRWCLYSV